MLYKKLKLRMKTWSMEWKSYNKSLNGYRELLQSYHPEKEHEESQQLDVRYLSSKNQAKLCNMHHLKKSLSHTERSLKTDQTSEEHYTHSQLELDVSPYELMTGMKSRIDLCHQSKYSSQTYLTVI